MAAEKACILDPQAVWVQSTMTEAKIQALVDRGLLRPKTEVEWRAAAGEDFPSEDIKEQVVFGSFFARGFNLEAFTCMSLKKMVPTCVPLKRSLAPVCHRPKLLFHLRHSVWSPSNFCR
jgi:hypothetical protein